MRQTAKILKIRKMFLDVLGCKEEQSPRLPHGIRLRYMICMGSAIAAPIGKHVPALVKLRGVLFVNMTDEPARLVAKWRGGLQDTAFPQVCGIR